MTFSTYLKKKLSDTGVSSKSVIAKLQLFSPAFEKLDPVTLSRWLNERTIPTLEKQLLVVLCLESKVYPYLEYISAPSVSRSLLKVYETVFNNIESSYHSILTYKDASNSNLTPQLEELSWSNLQKSVPGFFESTQSYKKNPLRKTIEYKRCHFLFIKQ